MMIKELKDGIQTVQYQIQTLNTSNGQAPFVTLFLNFDPNGKYAEYAALICEEVLKQRIQGVKNSDGIYITPSFPKLIYCLDDHNINKDSKYYYLTELAAKCTAKRMYPDYISAKKMRELRDGEVYTCMGCRSFLSNWKDPEINKYKWDGRFNIGVVSINLPQIAILVKDKENKKESFFKLLEKRLELCKEALIFRHDKLLGTTSDISPIHWQDGAIARLKSGEKIDKYLLGGYSTASLGYIGIYEVSMLLTGESHTKHPELVKEILEFMDSKCKEWNKQYNIGFSLYGSPAESLCYRFAKIDKEKFGDIKDVTDKGYYTNSFHVDVREDIDAFSKLKFEAPFHEISTGGCLSYIEMPSMTNNTEAILSIIKFCYDNIIYAEFNTKLDYCYECGFEGEIVADGHNGWICPKCGNKDQAKMSVTRRTCGYLGDNFWNEGRTKEIQSRVLHI